MALFDRYYFKNYIKTHPEIETIVVDRDTRNKIENFVDELIENKQKEHIHKIDGIHERHRQINGLLGEAALEKLLNIKIIEQSIGASSNYNHPDIPGYEIGIKTSIIGYLPLIPKKNNYPQIINFLDYKTNTVYVCGLATSGVLNVYQNDNYAPESVRNIGQKTVFTGLNHLIPIHCLDDLKEYKI